MTRVLHTAVAVALVSMLASCGGAQTPTGPSEADRVDPRHLYPLGEGYVWTYDVDTGTGLNTLAISRVVSHRGNRFEVSNGSDPIPYEVRPEGIFRVDKQTWLLRSPIQVGASWESALGGRAEVTNIHATADTVEGTFRDCVEIRETGENRTVRSIFCADVGLVFLESVQSLPIPGDSLTLRARLRGHLFEPTDE